MMEQRPTPQGKRQVRSGARRNLILGAMVVVALLAVPVSHWAKRLVPPQSLEQHMQKGLAFHKQQQYDAAVREFTEAIRVRPEMTDAYLYRGIALYAAGQLEASITDFNKVLELRPESATVYLYRGDSYLALGQRSRAVDDYQQALTLADGDEKLTVAARTKLYLMEGASDR